MTFTEAVQACFKKYATFSGRAAKAEFWWFALFQFVACLVAGMLSDMLSMVVSLGLLLPALAVGARRLHDIDKSGWLQLLWIIPVIGWAILIYWLVQPTGPANQYGGGPSTEGEPVVVPGVQS